MTALDARVLDPDELNVLRRMRALIRNLEAADAAYDAIPESRRGLVVSTDVARFLAPEFHTREGRSRYTDVTSFAASPYGWGLAKRRLAEGHRSSHGAAPLFLSTAGGAGSGKTSSLWTIPPGADLIFDNQLLSYDDARSLFDHALLCGWNVCIHYIQRPFHEVVGAVLARSYSTGREYRMRQLAAAHHAAQQAILSLCENYMGNPRVTIVAILNRAGHAPEVISFDRIANTADLGYASVDGLRSEVERQLWHARASGDYPADFLGRADRLNPARPGPED